MAAGFIQGAGFNPANMKTLLFVMVFALVFATGAWLGTLILKAYGDGDLNATDAVRACVSLAITVVLVLGVLSSIFL